MKKIILATAIFISMSFTPQSDFCAGFEDGFCQGYKYAHGSMALCPITPICPIPPIGCDWTSYRCGYNSGFVVGMER